MNINWGYSPKKEKYIPLGDFPGDRYLVVAQQAFLNLGWKISHISETEIVAFTPISWQSYSEEVSVRIINSFAVVKSECVGIQFFFNDYGKNMLNLTRFFDEFEYVEFHINGNWEEHLNQLHSIRRPNNDQSPFVVKNRIKNELYLFFPQKGYIVTPLLVLMNVLIFGFTFLLSIFLFKLFRHPGGFPLFNIGNFFASSRSAVQDGQLWRLLTYQFLHGGILHLIFNMYALIYLGLVIEHKLGWLRFGFIYLASGICAAVLSLMVHDSTFTIGASGAIMGLFGALLMLLLLKVFEKEARNALLLSTIVVIALMLLNGLIGKKVDNAAHLGGLISGFVLCGILYPNRGFNIAIPLLARYAIAVLFAVGFCSFGILGTPKLQAKEFLMLEQKFKANWVAYHRIFRIPDTLSTGKKLQIVQRDGIDLWKRNTMISDEMLKLNLPKQLQARAKFHSEMARIESRIVELLYKECAESTKYYRREIRELNRERNSLRITPN